MTYVGSGGVDWDVARDTDGSALLENGDTRDVSPELAARLVLHNDWEAPKNQVKKLREAAEKQREEASALHGFDRERHEALAKKEKAVNDARLEAEHEAFKAATRQKLEAEQRSAAAEEAGNEAADSEAANQEGGA